MTTIELDAPTDTKWTDIGHGILQSSTKYRWNGEEWRRISGLPWTDDHTESTRWMAGKFVADNLPTIANTSREDLIDVVKWGAAQVLNGYARRGTAVHKYLECRVLGEVPPWDQIAAAGAGSWIAAVDAYLKDHPPKEPLTEITVFGKSAGVNIGGTVDLIELGGPVAIFDAKSRTASADHKRKAKEAAQLGAYAHCLLTGCYINDRGHERTLDHIDYTAVVTFAPDGTYAIHRTELADALRAHEARMQFLSLGVRDLFAKAIKGEAPTPAEVFQAELDAMHDADKMALAALWREHNMPRIADLGPEHYVTARRLFMQAGPWFDGPEPPLAPLATDAQVADLHRRISALPDDIAKQIGAA